MSDEQPRRSSRGSTKRTRVDESSFSCDNPLSLVTDNPQNPFYGLRMLPFLNYVSTEARNNQTANSRYVCKICGDEFKSSLNLQKHLERYIEHDSHKKCKLCKRVLATPSEFVDHVNKNHWDGVTYKCNECSKTFTKSIYLANHRKIHNKQHQCHVCNKGFTQRSHLEDHMWRHDGVKKYECPVCKTRFSHKTTLEAHIKNKCGAA